MYLFLLYFEFVLCDSLDTYRTVCIASKSISIMFFCLLFTPAWFQ